MKFGVSTLVLIFCLLALSIFFDLSSSTGPLPDLVFISLFVSIGVGTTYLIITKSLLLYFIKRILEALGTIVVVATVTFLLLRFLPGGPFDSEKVLPPEIKANIERKYNLDSPLLLQYLTYMKNLAKGDLGQSYKYVGRSVSDIIKQSIKPTFKLGFYAILVAFLIGIPIGVLAASRHNTLVDNLSMACAISGVALPNFLLGALFILFFSLKLGWLPAALWESPIYYVLPVLTLGIRPISIIARLTRSSVLDIIKSDYIRTAWAKGLSERVILFKHVLKNSLIPVLSISGPLVANLLSGSFVVEIIFAIPGMGKHLIQSVNNRDYPLILGLTLLYSLLLVLANLIVDLLYCFLDPRIKLS